MNTESDGLLQQSSLWDRWSLPAVADIVVIGGGITGLSTAISLKERSPKKSVVIVEARAYGSVASTKNAGFACIGSVGELIDDLAAISVDQVGNLLAMRFKGLRLLRERMGDKRLQYREIGGTEVFRGEDDKSPICIARIPEVNDIVKQATGLSDTFSTVEHRIDGDHLSPLAIYNQYEGALHTGAMMYHMEELAKQIGVSILRGITVNSIDTNSHEVLLNGHRMSYGQLAVCTNSLAADLIDGLAVEPAINLIGYFDQKMVSAWKSTYHMDRGYTYFRVIDDHYAILGGGRHVVNTFADRLGSDVDQMKAFLRHQLTLLTGDESADFKGYWAGLLGVGDDRQPICQEIGNDVYAAVRLGGMGVAIGSLLGQQLADLIAT